MTNVTIGDILGWLAVLLLIAFTLVLMRFLWFRAKRGTTNIETIIIQEIDRLDRQIQRLNMEIDNLRAERARLVRQAQDHARLRRELEEKGVVEPGRVTPLVVAIGEDSMLQLDLAVLRAVRTHTGMELIRIDDATLGKIKAVLDRLRANGRRANVHLAVHSDEQGVLLGGEQIDAGDLSEILDGVQVLLIAGCESSRLGDMLGVVPFVISISVEVSHGDASSFTRLFWMEIGKGLDPEEAMKLALDRAPSGMREFVVLSI